jgi:spore germination protein KA
VVEIFWFKKEKKKPQHSIIEIKETNNSIFPSRICECEALLKSTFCNSADIIIQAFETKKEKAMIVFIDGLTNKDLIDRDIINPLKSSDFSGDISLAIKTIFKEANDIPSIVGEVLQGNIAVFYEYSRKASIVEFKQWDRRAVGVPDSESVIRGPKEGFTESIRTNTALIRRKVRTSKLIIESLIIGRQTNTPVGIVYIEGIVNQDVLKELKYRLSQIDTDSILESGHIEQYIDKNTFSPVSSIGVTQKPDIVATRILEGRIAILCDGTPHVLTVPEFFLENIQSSEDYYNRAVMATITRVLRLIGLFITMMLPGTAVAIMTYNQEMLPSVFLTSLVSSTQRTPMPAAAEIFLLIIMFELLKEAGERLPKTVGSAITIVGSLIIGDAAVNAGIVGAPMVIIVALTAVTGYIVPNLAEYIIVYRLLILLLGSTMGLIGIGASIVIILTQLISTNSFGIPILSSFSKNEMKDLILRFPLKSLKYRPSSIAKDNIRRR